MANSLKDKFDANGSNLAVPISPNPNPTLFNDGEDLPAKTGIDFLLRNGFRAPADAVRDVSRLFKMFKDLKSPNGLLFTAAQNILSRTAVKTEASYGIGYGGTKEPNFNR